MANITGTAGADSLVGTDQADRLDGGAGNDTLVGGRGYDTLVGGAGRDVFRYLSLAELIDGDWFEDFSADDLIDLSAISGLRVIVADTVPRDLVPSESAPVLLLKERGTLELWIGTAGLRMSMSVTFNLEETAPGSRLLQVVPGLKLSGTGVTTSLPATLMGGRGVDTIEGGAGAEVLLGGDSFDEVSGGGGDDTIVGGRGNDVLTGGPGNDVFRYDTLQELIDSDWIRDFSIGDRVDLSALVGLRVVAGDTLPSGLAPSDAAPVLLLRPNGELLLWTTTAGPRSSLMLNRPVEETAPGSRILQAVLGKVLTGTDGPDTLVGGPADDTLSGGGGDDLLLGGGGRDRLDGGPGDDTLVGGPGYDALFCSPGRDVIRYEALSELVEGDWIQDFAPGDQVDLSAIAGLRVVQADAVPAGMTPSEAAPVVLVRAGGILEVWTQAGASQAWAKLYVGRPVQETAPGSRVLQAEAGVLRVGLAGADVLTGGIGDDTLQGEGGDDTLVGGDGNDLLWGGGGADLLFAGPGQDTLRGGGGADTYRFDSVADLAIGKLVQGLDGGDRLDFSRIPGLRVFWGNTVPAGVTVSASSPVLMVEDFDPVAARQALRLYVDSATKAAGQLYWEGDGSVLTLEETAAGSRVLRLSPGMNLVGTAAAERLTGGAGADTLLGGDGADTLEGGASQDILRGGDGDDVLIGGAGRDTLEGGAGSDTFKVLTLAELLQGDAIADFSEDDRLDLSGVPGLRIVFGNSLPADVVASEAAPVLLVTPSGLLKSYAGPSVTGYWMYPVNAVLVETAPGSRILMIEPAHNTNGTDQADNLVGTARSERMAGGLGDDVLEGGGGDDTLLGGPGDDRLQGGDGNNELWGGPGSDVMGGGNGSDRFVFDAVLAKNEYDNISYMDPSDRIDLSRIAGLRLVWGDGLPDGVVPSDTSPVVVVSTGRLRFYTNLTESGSLFVSASQLGEGWPATLQETSPGSGVLMTVAAQRITGSALNDTLSGGAGSELIEGGEGNDLLMGGPGADRLRGGPGQDTLVGGPGEDTLDGGPGVDVYRFDALGDVGNFESLEVGAGDLIDFSRIPGVRVVFGNNLTFPSSPTAPVVLVNDRNWIQVVEDPAKTWRAIWVGDVVLKETAPGSGILKVDGMTTATAEGSLLTGTDRPDALIGAQGPDTLVASGGNDTLTGGAGRDVFRFTSLELLSASKRLMDFSAQDVLDLSSIAGLKVAYGDALPPTAVPSAQEPWLLVKPNGFLDVFDGSARNPVGGLWVDVAAGPVIVGNPQLRETAPGSRVLQQVAAAEPVQSRWFDASGASHPGATGAPIQFVVLADGYQSGQEELFFAKAQELMAAMFAGGSTSAFKPLGDYAALFEMVAVFVPSREGIRSDGRLSDSAFRTSTSTGLGTVSGDYDRVRGFVSALNSDTAFHLPVVLLNTDYGRSTGGEVMWLVGNGGSDAYSVFVHEMGHSLFGFWDEYADAGISPAYPSPVGIESAHLSSSPTQVPWSHWLGYEDDLGTVGVYEGGLFRETGVWRATANSMMRSHGVEFNAPQKEAMVARLYALWGDYLSLAMDDRMGFVAQSRAPGVLNHEWRVDGKVLAHTGSSLSAEQMLALGVAPLQRHVVEVRTVDNSGWLRLPELLDASRQSEVKAAVWGTTGSDVMVGTAEGEWLMGGAGNDQLGGRGGADTIDGGAGRDEAAFRGAAKDYRLEWTADGRMVVVDGTAGRDGSTTLIDVEQLRFANGKLVTLDARDHAGYADLPATMYQFFILAFGAAPGVEYLQQCADAYRSGASVKLITNVFTGKSQFTDIYPTSLSNRDMATKLVTNVVGTSATQTARDEAIRDITGALDNGLSRGDMIFTVFSNLAGLKGDAKWGGTAQLFFNQIAVAKFYTETMNQSTTDRATLAAAISAVTATSDVATDAAIVTLIGQGLLGG